MRNLRRAGLLSSFLIVGVLGGLMAPLSSEADNTSVTFQVDSGTVATLLNVASGATSTCTVPSGYSRCYRLPTGQTYTGGNPSRSYTITGYDGATNPVALPRLLVTDTGGIDNLTFTTVEFKPVATTGWDSNSANCGACAPTTSTSYGEQHTLTVVITHTFGLAANVKTASPPTDATKYKFALRASGMFKGNPTGYATIANATASGDFVKFEGDGKFGSGSTTTRLLSPFPPNDSQGALPACNTANSRINSGRTPSSDVNYCPLRRTMAGTLAPTSSFSTNPALEQVNVTNNPYPSYSCDSNGTDCRPTVILKLTATMYGPDSWVLSSSGDAAGGSCNLVPPGPPVSTPAVPCQSQGKGKKNTAGDVAAYFDAQDATDAPLFAAEFAESTPACEGEACVCGDPDVCGVPISLFNTGLAEGGSVDPNYSLIQSPYPYLGPNAIVANPPAGAWVPNTVTSKWISPSANQSQSDGGNANGNYTYRTTFDLTGLDPGSASITGQWATDNGGIILINGSSTGQTTGIEAFGGFTPFSISTGFIAGLNMLDFVVNNYPGPTFNPTGLRVEMSGTATRQ
jgi:hypothetical protein